MIDVDQTDTKTIWQVSWKVVYRVGKDEHHLHTEQHKLFTSAADAKELMHRMQMSAEFLGIQKELRLTISPTYLHLPTETEETPSRIGKVLRWIGDVMLGERDVFNTKQV